MFKANEIKNITHKQFNNFFLIYSDFGTALQDKMLTNLKNLLKLTLQRVFQNAQNFSGTKLQSLILTK